MTASFDRLSGLVDQAVAKINTPPVVTGTPDTDLDTLSDKIDAALNPVPAELIPATLDAAGNIA